MHQHHTILLVYCTNPPTNEKNMRRKDTPRSCYTYQATPRAKVTTIARDHLEPFLATLVTVVKPTCQKPFDDDRLDFFTGRGSYSEIHRNKGFCGEYDDASRK
jgi:hypothetical protein